MISDGAEIHRLEASLPREFILTHVTPALGDHIRDGSRRKLHPVQRNPRPARGVRLQLLQNRVKLFLFPFGICEKNFLILPSEVVLDTAQAGNLVIMPFSAFS